MARAKQIQNWWLPQTLLLVGRAVVIAFALLAGIGTLLPPRAVAQINLIPVELAEVPYENSSFQLTLHFLSYIGAETDPLTFSYRIDAEGSVPHNLIPWTSPPGTLTSPYILNLPPAAQRISSTTCKKYQTELHTLTATWTWSDGSSTYTEYGKATYKVRCLTFNVGVPPTAVPTSTATATQTATETATATDTPTPP